MPALADAIVIPARRARAYAERLLKEIRPDQFARKPAFASASGRLEIDTNHAAFVYGHLALYPAWIMGWAGVPKERVDASGASTPPSWLALFKAGESCRDDPAGSIYPPMPVITAAYFRGYDAAIDHVAGMSDAELSAATTEERFREAMPRVNLLFSVLLNNHVLMHLGQVSAWRRCLGLGPA